MMTNGSVIALEHHPPERLRLRGLERVRSALERPAPGFGGAQPDRGIDPELVGDGARIPGVGATVQLARGHIQRLSPSPVLTGGSRGTTTLGGSIEGARPIVPHGVAGRAGPAIRSRAVRSRAAARSQLAASRTRPASAGGQPSTATATASRYAAAADARSPVAS